MGELCVYGRGRAQRMRALDSYCVLVKSTGVEWREVGSRHGCMDYEVDCRCGSSWQSRGMGLPGVSQR